MSLTGLFDEEPRSGPFTILTVCTGNICRSPLAESLLRRELRELPVIVRSAGTHALVGEPMTPQNQQIAKAHGASDVAGHRARQLTEDNLREADLVLALSREHRREIAEMLPRVNRVAFTLREFARLSRELLFVGSSTSQPSDPGARMRQMVASLSQLRGTIAAPEDPADDDVVDPYRRSDSVYAQSADQLVPAVKAAVSLLRRAAARQS